MIAKYNLECCTLIENPLFADYFSHNIFSETFFTIIFTKT